MPDSPKPFAFTDFVPGFDFLKNLATGAAANAGSPGSVANPAAGLTGLSSWIAPTLSVEEVDKRIKELKTVQFWLEQNLHALKATIQALEVQRMTLSTLKGMNVQMEDLAKAFSRGAGPMTAPKASPTPKHDAASAPAPSPAPMEVSRAAPEPSWPSGRPSAPAASDASAAPAAAAGATPAGVIDPMQWWGALTQQFEQIASTALREAAALKMPGMPEPGKARSATKNRAASADGTSAQGSKGSKSGAAASPKPAQKAAKKTTRKSAASSKTSRRSGSGAA